MSLDGGGGQSSGNRVWQAEQTSHGCGLLCPVRVGPGRALAGVVVVVVVAGSGAAVVPPCATAAAAAGTGAQGDFGDVCVSLCLCVHVYTSQKQPDELSP